MAASRRDHLLSVPGIPAVTPVLGGNRVQIVHSGAALTASRLTGSQPYRRFGARYGRTLLPAGRVHGARDNTARGCELASGRSHEQ